MTASHLKLALQCSLGSFCLDVQLDLPSEGITTLFGPSGCGKSTLLRCIAGLEPSARGQVHFGGQTWLDSPNKIFVPAAKRRLGFVFQDGALFPHLNVEQNLRYSWQRVSLPDRRFSIGEIVEMLDLSSLSQRKVDDLSGGERQRVALGRAILSSPNLLLLDEPLASLDRLRRREILPYFERLSKDLAMTVLYVTHNLDEASRLGDHLVVMDDGRIAASGPLFEIMSSPEGHLLKGHDRRTVIPATVLRFHQDDHLLELGFPGGTLWAPASTPAENGNVRLSIRARDVSLTLQKPEDSSVLNILPGVIIGILEDGPGWKMLQIGVGNSLFLAQITTKSYRNLGLAPGKQVFAQIKSVALL